MHPTNIDVPQTFWSWAFVRGSLAKGLKPAVEMMTSNIKVYPLAKAKNPPKTEFIDFSDVSYNTISPNDFGFYEDLNQVIQKEPIDSLDPMYGPLEPWIKKTWRPSEIELVK